MLFPLSLGKRYTRVARPFRSAPESCKYFEREEWERKKLDRAGEESCSFVGGKGGGKTNDEWEVFTARRRDKKLAVIYDKK